MLIEVYQTLSLRFSVAEETIQSGDLGAIFASVSREFYGWANDAEGIRLFHSGEPLTEAEVTAVTAQLTANP